MKSLIIDKLKAGGLSATEAENALADVAKAIRSVADENEKGARVPGLGTFKFKHRAPREVRNPATGEMMTSAAKTVLTFKQGNS